MTNPSKKSNLAISVFAGLIAFEVAFMLVAIELAARYFGLCSYSLFGATVFCCVLAGVMVVIAYIAITKLE